MGQADHPHIVSAPSWSGAPAADRIVLTGIAGQGHHGAWAPERRDGQTFTADVMLTLDTRAAAAADDLGATADYGAVAQAVYAVLTGEPVDLLETLAERVALACLTPPVVGVTVTVRKPLAPVPVPLGEAAVTISRVRADIPGAPTVPAVLDAVPAAPVRAVVAMGGNLGPVRATLRGAIAALNDLDAVEVRAVSPLARTKPVGGVVQPDFCNAVALCDTTLAPRDLLLACLELERRANRQRTGVHAVRWGPRTLDLDVIAYGDLVAAGPGLELPHPRAHQRAFVLAPWAALEPDAVLPGPGGGRVAELAAQAPDAGGLVWEAQQWPWPQEGDG